MLVELCGGAWWGWGTGGSGGGGGLLFSRGREWEGTSPYGDPCCPEQPNALSVFCSLLVVPATELAHRKRNRKRERALGPNNRNIQHSAGSEGPSLKKKKQKKQKGGEKESGAKGQYPDIRRKQKEKKKEMECTCYLQSRKTNRSVWKEEALLDCT